MLEILKHTLRGGVRLNDVHPNKRGASDKEAESVHERLDNLDNVLHEYWLAGYRAVQWDKSLCHMEQPDRSRSKAACRNHERHYRIADWVSRERHAELDGQQRSRGLVHRAVTLAGGGVANHGIHPIEPQSAAVGVDHRQHGIWRFDGGLNRIAEARRRRDDDDKQARHGIGSDCANDGGEHTVRMASRHNALPDVHEQLRAIHCQSRRHNPDERTSKRSSLRFGDIHYIDLATAGGGVAHGLHSPKPRIGESDTSATRYIDIEQERVHRDVGKLQRVREGRACDHQNKAEFERYTRGLHVQSVPDNWIQGMPEHYCWRSLPRDTKFCRQCLDISRYESYGKLNIRRRTGGVAAVALAGVVA